MAMSDRLRGYTLIELLVVMALIGMLLSLAGPRYLGHVDKAKEAVLRQDLAQMRDGIQKYFGDFGRYPDSLQELVDTKYLQRLPVDPVTDRSDTWLVTAPAENGHGKVFDVKSGATGQARDGSAYASW